MNVGAARDSGAWQARWLLVAGLVLVFFAPCCGSSGSRDSSAPGAALGDAKSEDVLGNWTVTPVLARRSPLVRLCHQACVRGGIGRIYFLHMRKAGGSSLAYYLQAHVGAALFEPTPPLPTSTTALVGRLSRLAQAGHQADGSLLRHRLWYNTADGLSFFWNEMNPFPEAVLGDARYPQVFLTHLRDPIARIQSRYHMVQGVAAAGGPDPDTDPGSRGSGPGMTPEQTLLEWAEAVRESNRAAAAQLLEQLENDWRHYRLPGASLPRPTPHCPHRIFFDVVSNYYVKRLVLAGRLARGQPPPTRQPETVLDCAEVARLLSTPATRADLAAAKRVLRQFDVVLLADEGLHHGGQQQLLEARLGPTPLSAAARDALRRAAPHLPPSLNLSDVHANANHHRHIAGAAYAAAARAKDPAALAVLREWNALDLELYAYARRLVAERAANLARGGSVLDEDAWIEAEEKQVEAEAEAEAEAEVPSWCKVVGRAASCAFRWDVAPGGTGGTDTLHAQDVPVNSDYCSSAA